MRFAFRFVDNGTLHDDLVLEFGDAQYLCDSYFLAMDRRLTPKEEGAAKVRAVMRALLTQWADAVTALPDGRCAYLPYEFSDQFTRWIACRREDERVRLSRGFSPLEGWRFTSSDLSISETAPKGFKNEKETLSASYLEFVEAVKQCLDQILNHHPDGN